MLQARCLNCGSPLQGKYCTDCGQRASTRRFSVRTLRDEDFWEQNFSFTRGLPRTLLQLPYRPGYVAMDYLAGKRRQYFPFVGLLLLLIAADVVLRGYLDLPPSEMMDARYGIGMEGVETRSLGKVLLSYFKIVQLFIIPVMAWWLWLLFRGTGYNFWEWIVACSLLVAAQIWVALPMVLVANAMSANSTQLFLLSGGKFLAYLVTVLFMLQVTRAHYPKGWPRGWRILVGVLVVYLVTKITLVAGIFVIHFLETGNWNITTGDDFMINM